MRKNVMKEDVYEIFTYCVTLLSYSKRNDFCMVLIGLVLIFIKLSTIKGKKKRSFTTYFMCAQSLHISKDYLKYTIVK